MHKRGQGWRNGPRVSALVRLLREQGLAGRGSVASATAEGLIKLWVFRLVPSLALQGYETTRPQVSFLR